MRIDRRTFLASTGLSLAAGLVGPLRVAGARASPAVAAGGGLDWNAVRDQFDLSREYIHLATFFIASHPRPVREAIEKYRRLIDANPLFIDEAMFEPDHENLSLRVKKAIAEFVGGRPDEIALVPNTTTGLALLYNGLRIRPGQEVLTTTHDHYSHHESIRYAVEKSGATTRKIALHDGAAGATEETLVERLRAAIAPRTRAVGITWVHSSTGLKLPIRALAQVVKQANAGRDQADRCLLIVDGVHGLGAEDEMVAGMGADFLVSGTHKWMFGPRGTGMIWGRLDAWPHIRPTVPSFDAFEPYTAWMKNEPVPQPTQAGFVSPGGFYAYEHYWAVEAAFRFHQQLGQSRITERIHALNGQFREGLAAMRHVVVHTPRSERLSAGIVCFEVKGFKPEEVIKRLRSKRILASTSPYAVSYARVAAGIMTMPAEIETVLREIRALRAA